MRSAPRQVTASSLEVGTTEYLWTETSQFSTPRSVKSVCAVPYNLIVLTSVADHGPQVFGMGQNGVGHLTIHADIVC